MREQKDGNRLGKKKWQNRVAGMGSMFIFGKLAL